VDAPVGHACTLVALFQELAIDHQIFCGIYVFYTNGKADISANFGDARPNMNTTPKAARHTG